jgi:hypothetical protein
MERSGHGLIYSIMTFVWRDSKITKKSATTRQPISGPRLVPATSRAQTNQPRRSVPIRKYVAKLSAHHLTVVYGTQGLCSAEWHVGMPDEM